MLALLKELPLQAVDGCADQFVNGVSCEKLKKADQDCSVLSSGSATDNFVGRGEA